MKTRDSREEIGRAIARMRADGLFEPDDTALIYYDLDDLRARVEAVQAAFPAGTLHAVAMKANPLFRVLEFLRSLGTGLEVASLPELMIGLRAGFAPEKVVFDSPIKTAEEISVALEKGVRLNADSMGELDRIARLVKDAAPPVGLRVNPQLRSGAIAATSVAGQYSKFGVPITEFRDEIIARFLRHAWLRRLHLHVGSQGCEMSLLVDGIKMIADLAEEINALVPGKIEEIDIGGGLPVSYYADVRPISIQEYRAAIDAGVPGLFQKYKVITEFGRHVNANAAWAVSRVEYVKQTRDVHTAMIHLGADMFLRKCYNPMDWHHEIYAFDPNGSPKAGALQTYNVAGPLCFAGDIIARDIPLPELAEGDLLVIADVGAYTLGMWSRYNSRQIPKVVGARDGALGILRPRERIADLARFWEG